MAAETLVGSTAQWRGHLRTSTVAYQRLDEALKKRLAACRALRKEHSESSKEAKGRPQTPSLWWASGHVGQQGSDADPWHPPRVDRNGHTTEIWDPRLLRYVPVKPIGGGG